MSTFGFGPNPPPLPPTVPPHLPRGERRIHYDSLLGKPDLSGLPTSSAMLRTVSASIRLAPTSSMIALRRVSVPSGSSVALPADSILRISA